MLSTLLERERDREREREREREKAVQKRFDCLPVFIIFSI